MQTIGPSKDVSSADSPIVAANWIEDYLRYLRTERAYSAQTLSSYQFDLLALEQMRSGRALAGLTEHDVRRWVAGCSRDDKAPRSIARTLSCWRGAFDWLLMRGEALQNPVRGVRAPKAPRRLPKAISPDAASQLLDGLGSGEKPDEDLFNTSRDQAILELFYSSGLRLSELTSLDFRYFELPEHRSDSWVDLAQREAHVLGKGGKRRVVPMGEQAASAIRLWLVERERWTLLRPGADTYALFLSQRGLRLANRSVQELVKRRATRQGMQTRVHPHVLRHSFASHVLQSSGDLRGVQEMLGHASIATTQAYTALDFQRLAAVYDVAHPRAKRRGGAGNSDESMAKLAVAPVAPVAPGAVTE